MIIFQQKMKNRKEIVSGGIFDWIVVDNGKTGVNATTKIQWEPAIRPVSSSRWPEKSHGPRWPWID